VGLSVVQCLKAAYFYPVLQPPGYLEITFGFQFTKI